LINIHICGIFSRGNPVSFANHIFKGITKGRNRVINFDLFLNVDQFLHGKDIDQVLTAVS